MQLERLVNFHKALSDPTRIRILFLLAKKPLHGQALAGKLGLKPPTITHHIEKLRKTGLIKEMREKNTIYFFIDDKTLKRDALAIIETIFNQDKKNGEREKTMSFELEKATIIKNFFDSQNKLKQIPAQRKKKIIVLEHIIKGMETGRKYTEKEINEFIKKFHEDFATIRRELIANYFMYRKNGVYEINPPEMWSRI